MDVVQTLFLVNGIFRNILLFVGLPKISPPHDEMPQDFVHNFEAFMAAGKKTAAIHHDLRWDDQRLAEEA